jgi:hypothetical protein
VSFALAPKADDLRIDWEGGLVMLPCNFDGDNFVRYVSDIHSGAKEKEKAALAEFEASRRAKHDAKRLASGHLADGMGLYDREEEEEGSGGGGGELAEAHDPMAALDGRQRPPGGAPSDAWRSEYLMSSDRGGEELSVEAPLAHQSDFAHVDDANDQLDWEGFNRSPYVDNVTRPADNDELEHAWLMTNKNVREETVKRVTAELRRKYGYVKDGLKLGDVTGINDPRQKARQFPTVAKGSYVPTPKPAGR